MVAGTPFADPASCLIRVTTAHGVVRDAEGATWRSPSCSTNTATAGQCSSGIHRPSATAEYRPTPDRRRERRSRSGYSNGMSGQPTSSISRKRSTSDPRSQT